MVRAENVCTSDKSIDIQLESQKPATDTGDYWLIQCYCSWCSSEIIFPLKLNWKMIYFEINSNRMYLRCVLSYFPIRNRNCAILYIDWSTSILLVFKWSLRRRCAEVVIFQSYFLCLEHQWLIISKKNYSLITRLWMNHFGEIVCEWKVKAKKKKKLIDEWMNTRWDEQHIGRSKTSLTCINKEQIVCVFCIIASPKMRISAPKLLISNRAARNVYDISIYDMMELSHGKSNVFRWNFKLLYSLPWCAQPATACVRKTWNIDIIALNYSTQHFSIIYSISIWIYP